MENRDSKILQFLNNKQWGGATTGEIASLLNISNRQVGGIMSHLNRKGFVFTYTKGIIVTTNFLSGAAQPMGLSNSFYDITEEGVNYINP